MKEVPDERNKELQVYKQGKSSCETQGGINVNKVRVLQALTEIK